MEYITTGLVGIVSALAGYLFSLWRNRLLPWISMLEFSEFQKNGDYVEVSNSLAKATTDSWFLKGLNAGLNKLQSVKAAYTAALVHVKLFELSELDKDKNNISVLETGIEQLKSASTSDDIIKALVFILEKRGISDVLDASIRRSVLTLPEYDKTISPLIKYRIDDKLNDGCFSFYLPTSTLSFGSELNTQTFIAERLLPLADLISRLEKDKLIKIFQELIPIRNE